MGSGIQPPPPPNGDKTPPPDPWLNVSRRVLWISSWGLVGVALTVFTLPARLPQGGDPNAVNWLNIGARIVAVICVFLYLFCPFRRTTIQGILAGGDLSKLWEVVFAWGTLLALFSTLGSRTLDAAVTDVCPRVFVVWFLSILTLVATNIIAQLKDLKEHAAEVQRSVEQARVSVQGAQQYGQELAKQAGGLKKVAEEVRGDVRNLFLSATEVLKIDTQIANLWNYERPGEVAIDSFLSAIKGRAIGMVDVTKRLNDPQAISSLNALAGFEEPAKLIISKVLHPSVARYLAVDPMRFSTDGLSFTLEGDYLLYSRLVENLFRNLILFLREIDDKKFHIEVFTTLNVPPRMWYNVVIPVGWDRSFSDWATLQPNAFLDFDPRTNERWEQYKAAQALCIKLGKDNGRNSLGFTRCFLQEGRDETHASPSLFTESCFDFDRRSFVHEDAIASRNIIAAAIEKIAGMVADCRDMEILESELRLALGPMSRQSWNALAEDYRTCIQEHEQSDRSDSTAYLYPILYLREAKEPKKWRHLTRDFIENYQTSPQRALVWNIESTENLSVSVSPGAAKNGKPRLPWDLFAVGVSGPVEKIENLPDPGSPDQRSISWLFTVSLLTDERGSCTTTRVLTAADQGEAKGDFGAYTTFINDVLRSAVDRSGIEVTPLVP